MAALERDLVFSGLTRPQMIGGVSYALVVLNIVASTELFIVLKSIWVLAAAIVLHVLSWAASAREPRIFDIWRIRAARCGRSPTWEVWRCSAYRP